MGDSHLTIRGHLNRTLKLDNFSAPTQLAVSKIQAKLTCRVKYMTAASCAAELDLRSCNIGQV